MAGPTREEADELIRTPKVVSVLVKWKPDGRLRWKLEATVLAVEQNELLKLCGAVGVRNHSFVLLYQNYPLRKYTKHAQHRDSRTGQLVREPHKHIWDENVGDTEVYIPDDINPEDEIDDQFRAFCKECNIDLAGGYQGSSFILSRT